MKKSDQEVDELVQYIDRFVKKNGGHLNVVIDQDHHLKSKQFVRRLECLYGACQTTNLFDGLEDNAKEEK